MRYYAADELTQSLQSQPLISFFVMLCVMVIKCDRFTTGKAITHEWRPEKKNSGCYGGMEKAFWVNGGVGRSATGNPLNTEHLVRIMVAPISSGMQV